MTNRIRATLPLHPWLVWADASGIAGYAYAARHRVRDAYRWSVEVSVYVDPGHHHRGVARGLYRSLLAILAAQGFGSAYAGITLPNPASVALHEGLGFEPVGVFRRVGYKLGRWHDVGWWQRALRTGGEAPEAPRTLLQLETQPGWDALLQLGEVPPPRHPEPGTDG